MPFHIIFEIIFFSVSCQVATIDGRPFLKFKIGILVVGNQDNFEHIRCVKTRNYIFTDQEETLNFDDIGR